MGGALFTHATRIGWSGNAAAEMWPLALIAFAAATSVVVLRYLRHASNAALALALVVGFVFFGAGGLADAADGKEMQVVFEHDGDPVYRVIPPGRIPAIDDPRFVRGKEADEQMAPQEPVFGLLIGAEARAYSLWQLDHHEIVNDRMGGTALAATW